MWDVSVRLMIEIQFSLADEQESEIQFSCCHWTVVFSRSEDISRHFLRKEKSAEISAKIILINRFPDTRNFPAWQGRVTRLRFNTWWKSPIQSQVQPQKIFRKIFFFKKISRNFPWRGQPKSWLQPEPRTQLLASSLLINRCYLFAKNKPRELLGY
jgi:hypothetical protein